jgi:hypothetical protein
VSSVLLSRRGLILGATVSFFAAPAIVRASSLMAVRPFDVLAAAGLDIPIDTELHDYLAQYRSFQKGFLKEYRKLRDPVEARSFDAAAYGAKWSGLSTFEDVCNPTKLLQTSFDTPENLEKREATRWPRREWLTPSRESK